MVSGILATLRVEEPANQAFDGIVLGNRLHQHHQGGVDVFFTAGS